MAIKTLLSMDKGMARVFRFQSGSIYCGHKFNLTTRAQTTGGLLSHAGLEVPAAPHSICVRSGSLQYAVSFSQTCTNGRSVAFAPQNEMKEQLLAISS